MIFKCKMCGGSLKIQKGETVVTCEYCGSKQTLPRLDDERRASLYDRANHFRRNNEFDNAMQIYEQILNEEPTDAEAYWSLVLCRYGIEYVEDPASHKRVPTINRMQYTSVYDDDNYKLALQHADERQKALYQEEAGTINEIQKGILRITEKEDPFDIFICYKETDAQGRRTQDSVLGYDIYQQLTREGFKVFFSRVTLEDKLGVAYEPYIFAALNSAKVMIVLGTKPEHFEAVWVRNEWSRYLALIRNGAQKMLIPAYKDMDPYDLPVEFAHLQAQDMSRLGFIQDLIRGIRKILPAEPQEKKTEQRSVAEEGRNVENLLKRIRLFLEDGNWEKADQYCERVLDMDSGNAEAYLGKLMVELKVHRPEQLGDCAQPFDQNQYYQKAFQFADDTLRGELKEYIAHIIYSNAKRLMNSAGENEKDCLEAAKLLETIPDYQDSAALAKECIGTAEAIRKNTIYENARQLAQGKGIWKRGGNYQKAVELLETIPDWKDASVQAEAYRKKERARRIWRKRRNRLCIAAVLIGILVWFLTPRMSKYAAASSFFSLFQNEWAGDIAKQCDYRVINEVYHYINKKVLPAANEDRVDLAFKRMKKLLKRKRVRDTYGFKAPCWDAMREIVDVALEEGKADEALSFLKESSYEAGSYADEVYIFTDILEYEIAAGNVENFIHGRLIDLGSYEQDPDEEGKEPIQWLIVGCKAVDDGLEFQLCSFCGLDCQPYHTTFESVSWEDCYLHQWLNETFYNEAFSETEKSMIQGDDEKVSLLSREEFIDKIRFDFDWLSMDTDYAEERKREAKSRTGQDSNVVWFRCDTATKLVPVVSSSSWMDSVCCVSSCRVGPDGDISYEGIEKEMARIPELNGLDSEDVLLDTGNYSPQFWGLVYPVIRIRIRF